MANIKAIYSALIEERATVDYLLEYQVTRPLLKMKMKSIALPTQGIWCSNDYYVNAIRLVDDLIYIEWVGGLYK